MNSSYKGATENDVTFTVDTSSKYQNLKISTENSNKKNKDNSSDTLNELQELLRLWDVEFDFEINCDLFVLLKGNYYGKLLGK